MVLLVALLFNSISQSQSYPPEEYNDIILLDNGGIYRGKILEVVEGKRVIIERIDGVVFRVPHKRIYAITDEENYEAVRKEFDASPRPTNVYDFRGFKNITQFGYPTGVTTVNGGYINKKYFLGAGAGWGIDGLLVFGDFMWHMKTGEISPFLYADAGYTFDRSGFLFVIGAGIRSSAGDKIDIIFQIGYASSPQKNEDRYNGFAARIGTLVW
jgi:hypothetical protein